MGKKDKLLQRLKSKPKDFTYDELKTLLRFLGYEEINKGKTSGSRVAFYNEANGNLIRLHKPHPGNELKGYVLDIVIDSLKRKGEI